MLDIVYLAVTGVAGLVLGVIITATMLRKAVEKKSEKYLIEAQEKAEVYKKDKKNIFVLKTDIQFQIFFPEYLVHNIRKAWREGNLSKKIALKHLSMLRDEYFENYMSLSGNRKEKKRSPEETSGSGTSTGPMNFFKLFKS